MKLGIMQPYFMPYIGYFQLINAVDLFVVYDNIKYTKKGWINRNRILVNGMDRVISLPLKKAPDNLNINERIISEEFDRKKVKLTNQLKENYTKAAHYQKTIGLLKDIIDYPDRNLFEYLFYSIKRVNEYLGITTPLIRSSDLGINIEQYKSEEKVLAICKSIQAKQYLNPIGGLELYNRDTFKANGIDLCFLKSNEIVYNQYSDNFIPSLSIIDILMFNPVEKTSKMLNNYDLI